MRSRPLFAPLALALALVLLAPSCAALRKPQPPPPSGPEPRPPELLRRLADAEDCARRGDWEEAFKRYSAAQAEVEDPRLFRAVRLRIADALFHMGRHPAALSALAPLPELPGTLDDCRRLAMAARVFQAMGRKPEHVEALLEVALENGITGPGAREFKAAGFAELGRIYVRNRKLPRAARCFRQAARLHAACGDREQAEVCRNLAEYLR